MITKKTFLALGLVALVLVGAACGDEPSDSDGATEPAAAPGDCSTEPVTTDSGLQVTDTECGDGDEVMRGDTIKVNYTGKLEDGTVFDSTDGGAPAEFPIGVGQLIAGWDEGIPGMKEGGRRTLVIPPDLAYGPDGYPPSIPGNATLTFEIEVVEITSSAGSSP